MHFPSLILKKYISLQFPCVAISKLTKPLSCLYNDATASTYPSQLSANAKPKSPINSGKTASV